MSHCRTTPVHGVEKQDSAKGEVELQSSFYQRAQWIPREAWSRQTCPHQGKRAIDQALDVCCLQKDIVSLGNAVAFQQVE